MAEKTFLELPSGFKIPAIGFGTFQVDDPNEFEHILDNALEAGYRHFDTALVYGNEKLVGRVLNKWISTGKLKREDLFITTKLPMAGLNVDRAERFLKRSLDNLQLDYVDLYLIHFPIACKPGTDPESSVFAQYFNSDVEITDHVGVWKKLEEQVDAKRTRAIGLSNFNIKQIKRILDSARIPPACLQIEVHVYLQQRELVKFCQDNGIAVVAYSPLGSPGYNKFITGLGLEPKKLPNMLQDPVIKSVGEKHKKNLAQIMLRYLVQKNIGVIPKSSNPTRMKENIDIFNFSLDANDIERLDNLEVGEEGRVCDFDFGLNNHPEWPFPK